MQPYKSIFQPTDLSLEWQTIPPQDILSPKLLKGAFYVLEQEKYLLLELFLHGTRLYKINPNNTFQYINFLNIHISIQENLSVGKGIKLTLGQFIFEFYGDVESFFKYMASFCIQTDFEKKYRTHSMVGKGNTSKVFKVQCIRSKKYYASKLFDTFDDPENVEALLKEVNILRHLDHPNVIHLLEVYESYFGIHLIYEYMNGGELPYKQISQDNAIKYLYKLLNALTYINSMNIIHRDIKPQNILLKGLDDIVIVDFGLADFYHKDGNYLFNCCGTPGYMAPEILNKKPYGFSVDVYSAGVIFYQHLTGRQLFESKDLNTKLHLNLHGEVDFSIIQSEDCVDILKKMLEPKAKARLEARELCTHQIFRKFNRKIHTIRIRRGLSQEYTKSKSENISQKSILSPRISQYLSPRNSPLLHIQNKKSKYSKFYFNHMISQSSLLVKKTSIEFI